MADEVHRLQSGKDPECVWFQKIAEQGHYAGRQQPTATRQGIYMATPSGEFLASLNSTRPEQVRDKMREALARWHRLKPQDRQAEPLASDFLAGIQRRESHYPIGGLVWQIFARDLPRDAETRKVDWRTSAWNQDFAWVRSTELVDLLPHRFELGARRDLPAGLLERLCRAHLVDNVRGQTPPYRSEHIQLATWTVEVVGISDDETVMLEYRGETKTEAQGRWSVQGFQDLGREQLRERGVQTRLLGNAEYHRAAGQFKKFDLLLIGERWGGTQYNGRHDDLERAPIGFLMELVDDRPLHRVAPELFWAYGWSP